MLYVGIILVFIGTFLFAIAPLLTSEAEDAGVVDFRNWNDTEG